MFVACCVVWVCVPFTRVSFTHRDETQSIRLGGQCFCILTLLVSSLLSHLNYDKQSLTLNVPFPMLFPRYVLISNWQSSLTLPACILPAIHWHPESSVLSLLLVTFTCWSFLADCVITHEIFLSHCVVLWFLSNKTQLCQSGRLTVIVVKL